MLFISSELLVTDVSFDVCDLTLLHISLLWLFFCTFQEAIEKKEQRAKRFHFRSEVNLAQRNVALDRDMMKKGTGCLGGVFHSFPCHDLALLASPHMELVNLPLLRWPVNEELHQLCLSVLCVCVCVCVCVYSFGCVRTFRRLSCLRSPREHHGVGGRSAIRTVALWDCYSFSALLFTFLCL